MPTGCWKFHETVDVIFKQFAIAIGRPVRDSPCTFEQQIGIILLITYLGEQFPILKLLSATNPMILPQLILRLRIRQGSSASPDLRIFVHLHALIPHSVLFE